MIVKQFVLGVVIERLGVQNVHVVEIDVLDAEVRILGVVGEAL